MKNQNPQQHIQFSPHILHNHLILVILEAQVNRESQVSQVLQVHQEFRQDHLTKSLPLQLDTQVLLGHQDNQERLGSQANQANRLDKILKGWLIMENLIYRQDIPDLQGNQVFLVNQELQELQEPQELQEFQVLILFHQNPVHLP